MKILMLGWEFPPIISGGLGVACYAIAKQLAQKVDLSLIVPKVTDEYLVDKLELIGLNNQKITVEYEKDVELIESFESINHIKTTIDAYQEELTEEVSTTEKRQVKKKVKDQVEVDASIFSSDELYGLTLNEKVIAYTKEVLRIAKTKQFELIYAHDWMTFVAGVELKKRYNVPLVLHVHSLSYDRVGVEDRGWVHAIEMLGLEHADVVVPVSHYTGRVCAQHYNVDFTKIQPVHNGITKTETFRKVPKSPEKLVLFLGRITAQKGPITFLEIAKRVLQKNTNVRFVMAGTGDLIKEIISRETYLELSDKFHFTGFLEQEKVHDLLAMTDVYCMPSVSEPFGLSALEAVQFGVPAVISSQSGAAEVLPHALKANYWDVETMANHILSLLEDEKLSKKVIKKSLKDLGELTWTKTSEKLVAIFEDLIIHPVT